MPAADAEALPVEQPVEMDEMDDLMPKVRAMRAVRHHAANCVRCRVSVTNARVEVGCGAGWIAAAMGRS
jgi:hypothetical protein